MHACTLNISFDNVYLLCMYVSEIARYYYAQLVHGAYAIVMATNFKFEKGHLCPRYLLPHVHMAIILLILPGALQNAYACEFAH